jgi:hypothetical protein
LDKKRINDYINSKKKANPRSSSIFNKYIDIIVELKANNLAATEIFEFLKEVEAEDKIANNANKFLGSPNVKVSNVTVRALQQFLSRNKEYFDKEVEAFKLLRNNIETIKEDLTEPNNGCNDEISNKSVSKQTLNIDEKSTKVDIDSTSVEDKEVVEVKPTKDKDRRKNQANNALNKFLKKGK